MYFVLTGAIIYQMHKSIPIQCFEIKNNNSDLKNLKSLFFERENYIMPNCELQCSIAINRESLKWHSRATVSLCYLSFSCFLRWHGHPTWHGAPMPLPIDSKSTFLAPVWRDISLFFSFLPIELLKTQKHII